METQEVKQLLHVSFHELGGLMQMVNQAMQTGRSVQIVYSVTYPGSLHAAKLTLEDIGFRKVSLKHDVLIASSPRAYDSNVGRDVKVVVKVQEEEVEKEDWDG
jgi:hypothetical protein